MSEITYVALLFKRGVEPFSERDGLRYDANNDRINPNNFVVTDNLEIIVDQVGNGSATSFTPDFQGTVLREDSYDNPINYNTQVWQRGLTKFDDNSLKLITTYNKVDMPVSQRQANLRDMAANKRYNLECGGFYFEGKHYRTDRDGRALLLATSWVEGLVWKTWDKSVVQFDESKFNELKSRINSFVQSTFIKEAAITASIDAATTLEELDTIDASFHIGWPDAFYPVAPPPVTPPGLIDPF